jgi:hypothetical protein
MGRGSTSGWRVAVPVAVMLVLTAGDAAVAQIPSQPLTHVIRAGFVGFGTGDDVNCPTGTGVAGGVELRTPGRWFAGVGADLYVATPAVCTDVAKLVPHESGTADELSGITLLFAPRLSSRVGAAFDFEGLRIEPSLGAGAVYAPAMWGGAERSLVPWAGGALSVQPHDWRVGLLLEHGYHRVPVVRQIHGSTGARVVEEFGRWKRVLNVAVTLRR